MIAGQIHEAQIANRSQMYMDSSREAFERGKMRAHGILELPEYPGGGSTPCLCITSPESKVLTARGWLPLLDVRVGDLVLTHHVRWRPITALIVKPSAPYHRQARIVGPDGAVGCTHNHLWHTSQGWQDSIDIDNSSLLCYHLPREVTDDMSRVRYSFGESQQARQMSIVSVGVSLRETQGLSGGGVHIVRDEPQGKGTVGQPRNARANLGGHHQGCQGTPYPIGGGRRADLASQTRWTALELVLARRQRRQENGLPLSVGLDYGERPDPGRARYPSHQSRGSGRLLGKPRIDDNLQALQVSRGNRQIQEQETLVDLPNVRGGLSEVSPYSQIRPQILFDSLLPPGTAVYDLTVEEDHSFVIEGFVAHNTRCRCEWIYEEVYEGDELVGYNCTWMLDPNADHCEGCLDYEAKWNPLFVEI